MRFQRALLTAGLFLATGCYAYSPTRVESLVPGQGVRVHLTPMEAVRLEEIRRTDDRVMEGTFQGTTGLVLSVSTPVSRNDPMTGMRALTQTVEIPVAQVVEVEEKRLDRLRTGALVAGLTAGAVLGIVIATRNIESGGPGDRPTPPDQSRIPSFPILRIPVP